MLSTNEYTTPQATFLQEVAGPSLKHTPSLAQFCTGHLHKTKGHHNNPTPVQLHRLDYSRRLLKATQVASFLRSPAKQGCHIDSIQLPVACLC